eukprot:1954577-Amphidinium_carterae.1
MHANTECVKYSETSSDMQIYRFSVGWFGVALHAPHHLGSIEKETGEENGQDQDGKQAWQCRIPTKL